MRVLAESHRRVRDFTGARRAGAVKVLDLPLGDAHLWKVLSTLDNVWVAEDGPADTTCRWPLLVVIESAPCSQFDALHAALAEGLPLVGPMAAIAITGQHFHGQRGRHWEVAAGNFFLTAAFPLSMPASDLLPGLLMLPAVAVVDAIRCAGQIVAPPKIKWINDILIAGDKVAGVLAATIVRAEVAESAVIGIGVNFAQTPPVAPTPFVPSTSCLADAGLDTPLPQFTRLVLASLANRYDAFQSNGPAGLLNSYRAASCVVGRRVRIWDEAADLASGGGAGPLATGTVRAILDDLSLVIEGHPEPIARGRLAFDDV